MEFAVRAVGWVWQVAVAATKGVIHAASSTLPYLFSLRWWQWLLILLVPLSGFTLLAASGLFVPPGELAGESFFLLENLVLDDLWTAMWPVSEYALPHIGTALEIVQLTVYDLFFGPDGFCPHELTEACLGFDLFIDFFEILVQLGMAEIDNIRLFFKGMSIAFHQFLCGEGALINESTLLSCDGVEGQPTALLTSPPVLYYTLSQEVLNGIKQFVTFIVMIGGIVRVFLEKFAPGLMYFGGELLILFGRVVEFLYLALNDVMFNIIFAFIQIDIFNVEGGAHAADIYGGRKQMLNYSQYQNQGVGAFAQLFFENYDVGRLLRPRINNATGVVEYRPHGDPKFNALLLEILESIDDGIDWLRKEAPALIDVADQFACTIQPSQIIPCALRYRLCDIIFSPGGLVIAPVDHLLSTLIADLNNIEAPEFDIAELIPFVAQQIGTILDDYRFILDQAWPSVCSNVLGDFPTAKDRCICDTCLYPPGDPIIDRLEHLPFQLTVAGSPCTPETGCCLIKGQTYFDQACFKRAQEVYTSLRVFIFGPVAFAFSVPQTIPQRCTRIGAMRHVMSYHSQLNGDFDTFNPVLRTYRVRNSFPHHPTDYPVVQDLVTLESDVIEHAPHPFSSDIMHSELLDLNLELPINVSTVPAAEVTLLVSIAVCPDLCGPVGAASAESPSMLGPLGLILAIPPPPSADLGEITLNAFPFLIDPLVILNPGLAAKTVPEIVEEELDDLVRQTMATVYCSGRFDLGWPCNRPDPSQLCQLAAVPFPSAVPYNPLLLAVPPDLLGQPLAVPGTSGAWVASPEAAKGMTVPRDACDGVILSSVCYSGAYERFLTDLVPPTQEFTYFSSINALARHHSYCPAAVGMLDALERLFPKEDKAACIFLGSMFRGVAHTAVQSALYDAGWPVIALGGAGLHEPTLSWAYTDPWLLLDVVITLGNETAYCEYLGWTEEPEASVCAAAVVALQGSFAPSTEVVNATDFSPWPGDSDPPDAWPMATSSPEFRFGRRDFNYPHSDGPFNSRVFHAHHLLDFFAFRRTTFWKHQSEFISGFPGKYDLYDKTEIQRAIKRVFSPTESRSLEAMLSTGAEGATILVDLLSAYPQTPAHIANATTYFLQHAKDTIWLRTEAVCAPTDYDLHDVWIHHSLAIQVVRYGLLGIRLLTKDMQDHFGSGLGVLSGPDCASDAFFGTDCEGGLTRGTGDASFLVQAYYCAWTHIDEPTTFVVDVPYAVPKLIYEELASEALLGPGPPEGEYFYLTQGLFECALPPLDTDETPRKGAWASVLRTYANLTNATARGNAGHEARVALLAADTATFMDGVVEECVERYHLKPDLCRIYHDPRLLACTLNPYREPKECMKIYCDLIATGPQGVAFCEALGTYVFVGRPQDPNLFAELG